MTKLYLSYNPFCKNIIYQNNNFLVNKTNLYFFIPKTKIL